MPIVEVAGGGSGWWCGGNGGNTLLMAMVVAGVLPHLPPVSISPRMALTLPCISGPQAHACRGFFSAFYNIATSNGDMACCHYRHLLRMPPAAHVASCARYQLLALPANCTASWLLYQHVAPTFSLNLGAFSPSASIPSSGSNAASLSAAVVVDSCAPSYMHPATDALQQPPAARPQRPLRTHAHYRPLPTRYTRRRSVSRRSVGRRSVWWSRR
jgi:hypothetical protein